LVSAKAAYSRTAGKRLADSRARLEGLRASVKHAIAMGNLNSSESLVRAQAAIEKRLEIAESRFSDLRKSGPREWRNHRDALEDAWEDLAHSIKTLVSRIKDESK
jgi:hypothetical protein